MLAAGPGHDVAPPLAVVLRPVVAQPQRVAQLVRQGVGRAEPGTGVHRPQRPHHTELNCCAGVATRRNCEWGVRLKPIIRKELIRLWLAYTPLKPHFICRHKNDPNQQILLPVSLEISIVETLRAYK